MFFVCTSLVELNLSSFKASKTIMANNMFYDCTALLNLICDDIIIKYKFINKNILDH